MLRADALAIAELKAAHAAVLAVGESVHAANVSCPTATAVAAAPRNRQDLVAGPGSSVNRSCSQRPEATSKTSCRRLAAVDWRMRFGDVARLSD